MCPEREIEAGRGSEWLDSGAAGLADNGRRGVRCRSVLTDRPFMFLSSPAWSTGRLIPSDLCADLLTVSHL